MIDIYHRAYVTGPNWWSHADPRNMTNPDNGVQAEVLSNKTTNHQNYQHNCAKVSNCHFVVSDVPDLLFINAGNCSSDPAIGQRLQIESGQSMSQFNHTVTCGNNQLPEFRSGTHTLGVKQANKSYSNNNKMQAGLHINKDSNCHIMTEEKSIQKGSIDLNTFLDIPVFKSNLCVGVVESTETSRMKGGDKVSCSLANNINHCNNPDLNDSELNKKEEVRKVVGRSSFCSNLDHKVSRRSQKGSFGLNSILEVPVTKSTFCVGIVDSLETSGMKGVTKASSNIATNFIHSSNPDLMGSDLNKYEDVRKAAGSSSSSYTLDRNNCKIKTPVFNNHLKQGSFNLKDPSRVNGDGDRDIAKDTRQLDSASNNRAKLNSRESDFIMKPSTCYHLDLSNRSEQVRFANNLYDGDRDTAMNMRHLASAGSSRTEHGSPDARGAEFTMNPFYNQVKPFNQSDLDLADNNHGHAYKDLPDTATRCITGMNIDAREQRQRKELDHKRIERRKHFDPG